MAEGVHSQCIVRLICRMTDRICFFITILNIRNATVEQILIFWHYADFIFPQSTKFIRRTHHGTSMVWSLVKSNDFAPLRLEGVHMTHTP